MLQLSQYVPGRGSADFYCYMMGGCNCYCQDLKTIKNKIDNLNAQYHNRSPCHEGQD